MYKLMIVYIKRWVTMEDMGSYLFADRAARCNCATIICTRARIAFRKFLTIFSPLAAIVHLHIGTSEVTSDSTTHHPLNATNGLSNYMQGYT